jgi:hypothetical protein
VVGEGGEAGADGLAGHLIQEATRGKVDGAEDGAAPVGAWGHDLLALAPEDPGGPHPRQQVAVGRVLGPPHRPSGQYADVLVEVGEDLVAVGVAACDQAGPPPAGDLAHTAVQGPPADSWAAQLLPQPADVQALGWPSSRRMRWPSRGLPSRGRPLRARSPSPPVPCWDSRIITRRQPTRWGPCRRPSRSPGQPAGQAGLAYTLGDASFRRPRRVGGAVEGFSDPRGYCTSGHLQPGLRHNCRQAASRMPSTSLSCPVGTRRGPRSGGHGARSGRRPAPPSGPSSSRRRASRPTAWARGHGPAPAPPGTAAGG